MLDFKGSRKNSLLYQGTTLACPERSAEGAESNGCRNHRLKELGFSPCVCFEGARLPGACPERSAEGAESNGCRHGAKFLRL